MLPTLHVLKDYQGWVGNPYLKIAQTLQQHDADRWFYILLWLQAAVLSKCTLLITVKIGQYTMTQIITKNQAFS